MHVYEFQCVNSIDFSTHNDIDVAFLIIDFVVNIVEKIVDESTIMIFKCDYEQCDKNDHWFKNCRMKHSHLKKIFENRMKVQKNRRIVKKNNHQIKKKKEEKEKES